MLQTAAQPSASVRQYARRVKKSPGPVSQLSDLDPSLLKLEYANIPAVQTADGILKRLLSLEFADNHEKLIFKMDQVVKSVRRDENDRNSIEVQVAKLTTRIRNYKEHLHKHPKDKLHKRFMLMAVDKRNRHLRILRSVNYEAFSRVCKQLDISYTFSPLYHRRITKRWLAKKALCIQVYREKMKRRKALLLRRKQYKDALISGLAGLEASLAAETAAPTQ